MLEKKVQIINKLGLHARASAKLVNTAKRFQSEIKLNVGAKSVNAKSIMGLMMLAAAKGTEVHLTADGPDEEKALEGVETLINDRFGEAE